MFCAHLSHKQQTYSSRTITDMFDLDQLADVLSSVSRERILRLFAVDERLNANQVCRRLGLPISKVKRVRSALCRLAHAGDLLECVSALFPGLRKSAPTYTVLSVPTTTQTAIGAKDNEVHAKEEQEQEPVTRASTPPPRSAPSPPLPRTPTTPRNPCCVCRTTPSLVVLLPCRHQRVCGPCWDEYDADERRKHRNHLRSYPHRERSPLVVPCPICRAAVMETVVPF